MLDLKYLPGIASVESILTTNVTSKGQVTIPIEFRRALGITEGTAVDFEFDGNGLRLVPVKRRIFSRADGNRVPHHGGRAFTIRDKNRDA